MTRQGCPFDGCTARGGDYYFFKHNGGHANAPHAVCKCGWIGVGYRQHVAQRMRRHNEPGSDHTLQEILHEPRVPAFMDQSDLPDRPRRPGPRRKVQLTRALKVRAYLPDCDICGGGQSEPGAILLTPPKPDGTVRKLHCCTTCWTELDPT